MAVTETRPDKEIGIEPLIWGWFDSKGYPPINDIPYAVTQTLVRYVHRMGGIQDEAGVLISATDILRQVDELWHEYQPPGRSSSLEWMAAMEAVYCRPEAANACLLGTEDSPITLGTRAAARLNYARLGGYPAITDVGYRREEVYLKYPGDYVPPLVYPRELADNFTAGIIYLSRAILIAGGNADQHNQ